MSEPDPGPSVAIELTAAARDPAMPSLAAALDPAEAEREFARRLPRLMGEGDGRVRVRGLRIARYKPGRRCLIEYDVSIERSRGGEERTAVLGKVRTGRFGKSGFRLLDALWSAGFQATSTDGISVPEPLGTVPRFRMWVQRKVPGLPATDLIAGLTGPRLAARVAEAAHKLHRAGVTPERRHTMGDELRILHERLGELAAARPEWLERLRRILDSSDRLGAAVREPSATGIHRDLYADQIIVDGDRLHLIDFDLYCTGDPALDIGNFLGHLIEQALRASGDPGALAPVERALVDRFVELSGEAERAAVDAYATLTLVRHIHLSTRLPGRQALTETLLYLCEERLADAGSGP